MNGSSLEADEIRREVEARIAEERAEFEDPKAGGNGGLPSEFVDQCARDGELGDARLFISLARDRFAFDHAAGRWFRFTGIYWEEDLLGEVYATLQEVSGTYTARAKKWAWTRMKAAKAQNRDLERHAAEMEGTLARKVSALQRMRHLKDVLEFAAAGADSLGLKGSEFDATPGLLACANGVLDLGTLDFRPGLPGDFIRSPCPTEWRGLQELAPTWERFLAEIFDGKDDLVSFMRRLFGYGLAGTCVDHIFPVLYGPGGRNGKGTMLQTIAAVLGSHLSGPVSSELLLEQRFGTSADSATPGILSLHGKRVVWASETNENRFLNGGRVKWLCGGDTLTGRPLYGRHKVTFRPTHTLLLLTNHRPRVDAEDSAIWERILLVPFEVRFVDNPTGPNDRARDKDLGEKLKREASGILAWMARGLVEWRENGLDPPDVVRAATREYREGEDVLGQFFEEKCAENPTAWVRAGELYDAYKTWASDTGHKVMTSTRFGKRVQERFAKEHRATGNVYIGVGLLQEQR
jgi:putative DNA primase/helicase